jgi:predicted PurR-regulated permease PerM
VPTTAPEGPRRVIRISGKSAVLAVVAVVLAILAQRLFVAAHQPLSWALAAGVVAVLIDPVVDVLDRRLPRVLSVIIALLVAAAATWGVIYVAFDDLSSGVDRLSESARDAAEELEARDDSIGKAARDVDASRRVDLFVDALDERVTGTEDVLASTAGTAPTYFIGGILTLFFMSYGPRLAQSAVDQLPDPRMREGVESVVPRALRRSRRAILLTVAEGVVAGLAVAGAAALLDVPSPAALGLAAGVMAMLPHVGLVLGTLPLILLVLALKSELVTVVTVVVVLACQLGDSFWLRRRIARRSVHIGLLVPWVVALLGYQMYGVGGVAYGLALAVFFLAVLDELGRRSATAEAAAAAEPAEPAEAAEAADGVAEAGSEPERPAPETAGVPRYVRAE